MKKESQKTQSPFTFRMILSNLNFGGFLAFYQLDVANM